MYMLFGLIFIFQLITAAPTEIQKRNAVCDLRVSPLGNTYFRKTTPWGQELDLPCASGTLFQVTTCKCEHKRCYVLDSDPSSYMEYIDNIGDWVSGQCPQDMVYRDDYCMCTLQKDYVTTGPKTSLATVILENCPYRQKGPDSYEEYFPSINDWVTNYCPHGTNYSPLYCKCIKQATVTPIQVLDTTTKHTTTKRTIQPPADCPYIKVDTSSYKEYRDDLKDWLISYCPVGEIYSSTWCTCLVEGQTPDYSGHPTTPPLVQNCNYQKSGPTSYNEYVPEIGAWVTNNCAAGKVYSHPHCTCVDKDLVQAVPQTTTVEPTIPQQNPDCDLRPVGKSSYKRYEQSLQDWVTVNCHAGMVFNSLLCHCVREGVVVTSQPVTTTDNGDKGLATNPNCPYVPVSQRSYKEYVADLDVWVTNDCPSDMVFNVVMCSCHPDGSADIIVVPITTMSPLNIPTVPNCPHKKSGKGYLEYIGEINIWVYNVCPIDHEFVKEYCTCLSQSDISKIPLSTTLISTQYSSSSTTTKTTVKVHATSTTGKNTKHSIMNSSTQPPTTTIKQLSTTSTQPTIISSPPTTTEPITTRQPATTAKKTTIRPPSTTAKKTTIRPPSTTAKKTTIRPPSTTRQHTTTRQPTTTIQRNATSPHSTRRRQPSTIQPAPSISSTTLRQESNNSPAPSSTTTDITTATVKLSPPTKMPPTSLYVRGSSQTMVQNTIFSSVMTTTMSPKCEKSESPLGEKYYTTIVPEWGELTFMCPTWKIFYLPVCACVYREDRPSTTLTKTSTSTERITLKSIQPTTMTSTSTQTAPSSTTEPLTAAAKTTTEMSRIKAVCPLVPSPKGIEYFKIYLGTWGAIEMICPYHQIFVPNKCRCLPH